MSTNHITHEQYYAIITHIHTKLDSAVHSIVQNSFNPKQQDPYAFSTSFIQFKIGHASLYTISTALYLTLLTFLQQHFANPNNRQAMNINCTPTIKHKTATTTSACVAGIVIDEPARTNLWFEQ